MRKVFGWICYILGSAAAVWALQLIISCEVLSAISATENQRLGFWDFVLVSSGHHKAYPNGYFIHSLRDLLMLGWGALIIGLGREQFTFKPKTRTDKVIMVKCPECQKKTYADAYCRFCGFNLVTQQPSREAYETMPVWKVSLLAYSGVSAVLLLLNLLLVKRH
jgi:hypothetical protein